MSESKDPHDIWRHRMISLVNSPTGAGGGYTSASYELGYSMRSLPSSRSMKLTVKHLIMINSAN